MHGQPTDDDEIRREIAPCFVEKQGRRTDVVVLACTHYPLLQARFARVAPWPVDYVDPAPAIARRVDDLLGPARGVGAPASAPAIFTSGAAPDEALRRALLKFGLTAAPIEALAVEAG